MLRLVLFLVAASVAAQTGTVSGTVLDEFGDPLPGANVYLSGTQRGDATDVDGQYEITAVPAGLYRLVGSLVGYEANVEEVTVEEGAGVTVDFVMYEARRSIGMIRVEAPRDRRWTGRLDRFERAFLGESSRADSVRIVNPEVLELSEPRGTLVATAGKPIIIENRALGYRLTYDLGRLVASDTEVRYDGDVRFEPLTPADATEAARWRQARASAYRGSLGHLLQALVTDELDGSGFLLTLDEAGRDEFRSFDRPSSDRRVRRRDVFRSEREGGGQLAFQGSLGVIYAEAEDPRFVDSALFRGDRSLPADDQRSAIELRTGDVRLDARGTPESPLDLLTRGYIAFERLADLLPADYAPPAGM